MDKSEDMCEARYTLKRAPEVEEPTCLVRTTWSPTSRGTSQPTRVPGFRPHQLPITCKLDPFQSPIVESSSYGEFTLPIDFNGPASWRAIPFKNAIIVTRKLLIRVWVTVNLENYSNRLQKRVLLLPEWLLLSSLHVLRWKGLVIIWKGSSTEENLYMVGMIIRRNSWITKQTCVHI